VSGDRDEDWRTDWDGARLYQLRHFRSLPLVDKIRAVEEMGRLARALRPPVDGPQDTEPDPPCPTT
jgi:hypothetical protein